MLILFFVHFTVDGMMNFFAPLIPLLREKLHFTLTTAGILISIQSFSAAISQPLTALLVDRWPAMPWLPVGILGGAIAFTAIGWVPVFWGVALAIPLGGILCGLCHPDMAARAGRLSEAHNSLSISVFVTGGRLGFALGPLIAIAVAKHLGMEWLWLYVFVAILAMALVVRGLPKPPPREKRADGGSLRAELRSVRGPIALLFAVAVVRAIIMGNIGGYLPTLFVDQGLGLWRGGIANSMIFFSGAFGVMLGGYLGDRIGKRVTIMIGMVIALAGMVAFLSFPLAYAYWSLAVIGFGNFLPMGVSVALAQEFLPAHRGFASSLTLGGGWFIASFTSFPIAAAAERFGLLQVFWVLPVALAIGIAFAFFLPKGGRLGPVGPAGPAEEIASPGRS